MARETPVRAGSEFHDADRPIRHAQGRRFESTIRPADSLVRRSGCKARHREGRETARDLT
jgi:hypothetical protein